jgi:hypothetical protein
MEIMETATSAGTTDITAGAARGRLARRLAAGAGALAAVLGGAAALGATPAHAATNPSAAGVYSLTNVGTGGVAGVATGYGNVSPSTSSENQKWRLVEVDPSSPLWVTAQVSDSLGAAGASVPTHAYLIESEPDSAGITACLEPMSATPGAPTVVGGCFTSLVNELWYQVVVNGKTQLVNGSAATIAATPAGTDGFYTMPGGDIIDTLLYNTDSQTGPSNYDTPGDQALVLTASSSGQLVVEPSQAATYGSDQDWNVRSTAYAVDVPATETSIPLQSASVFYGCLNGWTPSTYNLAPASGGGLHDRPRDWRGPV